MTDNDMASRIGGEVGAATEGEPLPPIVLGFTGSRTGLTGPQSVALATELLPAREFHHGDCIGADGMAHALAAMAGCRIVSHPADMRRLRAFCRADEVREPKRPLDRNRDIVDETERLVACPSGFTEEQRSGTWATVRHARRVGREIAIIWPDGSVAREHSSPQQVKDASLGETPND